MSSSEAEDPGPFDPLTERLRALSSTASDMVHQLEKHVGDLHAQRSTLCEILASLDMTDAAVPIALAEILGWYSVLSILACSFPTRAEMDKKASDEDPDKKDKKSTDGSLIEERLELPPLLVNSSDSGQPLRPQFLGAASE